ncbi:hypothetical protein F5H01DRAFT_355151 [Linnemannia elongata]|nr:hypothetical protein F5H01DRAFT_355151 [Linnemannia elongata]
MAPCIFVLTNSSQGNNLAFVFTLSLSCFLLLSWSSTPYLAFFSSPFSILFVFAHFWSFFSPSQFDVLSPFPSLPPFLI